MEKSRLLRKSRRESGFTLIETMVAILVLTIGLFSVAALMSQSVNTTAHSRYQTMAAMLASEKLEDLNRYPNNDPHLAAGGSLGGDTVGYFDNVQTSTDNGVISETTSDAGGTTSYVQQPGAGVTVTVGGALPAVTSDTLTFDRRWTVIADTPVVGVRQITVLVTLKNKMLNPPVTYQISVVHQ
jgi:type IV pilus modification protein PilV